MDEIRILSPTAILGYGFPPESLNNGIKRRPHAIAVDAGSTDAGPYYLGTGAGKDMERLAQFAQVMVLDLKPLLKASLENGIPLIIGSAGGAGGNPHLEGISALVQLIAHEEKWRFKLALIQAEIDKDSIRDKLKQGKVNPLGPVPELTEQEIDQSVRIVAQMGVGPFIKALEQGAQVIIAGRASDPSMFAALPLIHGFDRGLALHMGKILECGAIAAEPGSGSDVMLGTLRKDHFLVEPMNPERRCTVASVAAHSLYEQADPWHLYEPGGMVDLSRVEFRAETERAVRVSGNAYRPSDGYRIKLEGAALVGYRTICMAGVRDPSVIAHLESILEETQNRTRGQFKGFEKWSLHFHVYGKNGVMGALEKDKSVPHEAGLLIEVIAPSQGEASSICMFVHAFILHHGFPGRTSTAGNLAFPFSPQDIPMGPVHRFNIYHLMDVEDPLSFFPIQIIEVGYE